MSGYLTQVEIQLIARDEPSRPWAGDYDVVFATPCLWADAAATSLHLFHRAHPQLQGTDYAVVVRHADVLLVLSPDGVPDAVRGTVTRRAA